MRGKYSSDIRSGRSERPPDSKLPKKPRLRHARNISFEFSFGVMRALACLELVRKCVRAPTANRLTSNTLGRLTKI